jgi:hypothetical protein
METVLMFALLVAAAYLILYVRGRLYTREDFYQETRNGSLRLLRPEGGSGSGSEESI